MISAHALTILRTLAFAFGGLVCASYALAALAGVTPDKLPHWLPPFTAACIFVVIFFASLSAGKRNTKAALDESYQSDISTASGLGFWTALGTGTALWVLDIGGHLQLAITLTSASAVFFISQVTLDLRGWN